ncbi:MAG TPA: hypothetical protein VHO46_05180 [Bacteroidales bacterium]|nr:hypothetical protein [Bacteroidales bacterium]
MEKVYCNLSEEEFSTSRKVLLWIFSGLFFMAGTCVVILNLGFGKKASFPIVLSSVPYAISFVVGLIAIFSSMKRKNQFFSMDNEKLEFRFGVLAPKDYIFQWDDVSELVMPHKQKKALLHFKDGTSHVINLTWLQKKKSSLIRKHIYQAAWEKQLKISKVMYLNDKMVSK